MNARAKLTAPPVQKHRCAVYTRKSTEEGLDMEFNSLDAQREAGEAYVASQKAEGWLLVGDRYDDGGYSGGTLERPALQRLLADVEAGKIDVIVVYKIDRLSRSLMDFARLVEVFDRKGVTFVSVTQSFNTTTSMGRLTLNVLLSFAQFEREVIGERIRDKFAASRKKGIWMGGWAPFGYEVKNRKLLIDEAEAAIVRRIFETFAKGTPAVTIVRTLTAESVTNRYGKRLTKTALYKLLRNPVYVGEAVHKKVSYPGEHEPIISRALWDKVRATLNQNARTRANRARCQTPALLRGLIFDAAGRAMSPTHTRKGQRLYRYYVTQAALQGDTPDRTAVRSVPAGQIERAVVQQLRAMLQAPEIVAATVRQAQAIDPDVTETEIGAALQSFDPLWEELFPAEQDRIVQLLVERVDVHRDGIDIRLLTEGLGGLIRDLLPAQTLAGRAA